MWHVQLVSQSNINPLNIWDTHVHSFSQENTHTHTMAHYILQQVLTPLNPGGPCCPTGPGAPVEPTSPLSPFMSMTPFSPLGPEGPGNPDKPYRGARFCFCPSTHTPD
uniref:Uncharacterized protein n=1 Tax=Esox lucius TaxID=8010 RepID=A0AAY5KV29_ESOLU